MRHVRGIGLLQHRLREEPLMTVSFAANASGTYLGYSNTAAGSYQSNAAFYTTAGKYYILTFFVGGTNTTPSPSTSTIPVNWTLLNTVTVTAGTFWFYGGLAYATSTTGLWMYSVSNATSTVITGFMEEMTGASHVVQSGTGQGTLSMTFSNFANSNNVTYVVCTNSKVPTGFTLLKSYTTGSLNTYYKLGTSTTVTVASGIGEALQGGFEINASVAATSASGTAPVAGSLGSMGMGV